MQPAEEKVYTVTALTRLIKYTLEESFPSVWVEGEISNYIHHSSGHRYLSLKDEHATIKLTIWRSVGQYLRFEPEDGMKVRALGDISVYEKGGNYQLNVKRLVPVGVGELEVAFRQLYERLALEGLFDDARKQPLPAYPLKVGIVTSPTGAAVRDFIKVSQRRNDAVKLVIYPAMVQGKGAAASITAGIKQFNRLDDVDLIVVTRGGGSLEDLWAFNEEAVVRAIAGSKKPIVSAIGHEIDVTLSDLAADLRAPTPSAAAELVIWGKADFLSGLNSRVALIDAALDAMLEQAQSQLKNLLGRPVLARPESLLTGPQQYLDSLIRQMISEGRMVLEKQKNALSLSLSRLESLSPLAVLNRGYAVLKSLPSGKMIHSAAALRPEDLIEAVLRDGSATAVIKDVRKK